VDFDGGHSDQSRTRVITMHAKILRLGKKTIKRMLGIDAPDTRVKNIYEENEFLEAYSRQTDLRVETDPKSAVGGMWEEIGQLQFDFLLNAGLEPQHKMLDLGCGTLRGGRHFIKYLETENYFGLDISPKAIAHAKQLVQQEGLAEKRPHLLLSEKKDLKFREFSGESFDYILAQSVFTHLKSEHIKECFQNIGRVMHDRSGFYFTYQQATEFQQVGLTDFRYPFALFESLAERYGFKLRDRSQEYKHPRGQLMVEIKKI
jgi:SAM-dependent methyltransferase